MNESTNRALLVAGLSANVLFLMLTLLDYSLGESQYMWPIFVAWAFVILLLVILAFANLGVRVVRLEPVSQVVPTASGTAPPQPPIVPAAASAIQAKPLVVTEDPFPFVYNGYTLYSRKVALKNGGDRTIWFFSKRIPNSGEKARKPAGFHVGVNERTGLPFLKKGTGKDGEDLTPAAPEAAYRPQCGALTEDGKQCRNSARGESKYCSSHFGYQPRTLRGSAKRIEGDKWSPRDKRTDKQSVALADTKARVRGAKDTVPAVRKRSAT